jgi:hypothetical protein
MPTVQELWDAPMIEGPPCGTYYARFNKPELKITNGGHELIEFTATIEEGSCAGELLEWAIFYAKNGEGNEFYVKQLKGMMKKVDESLFQIPNFLEAIYKLCQLLTGAVGEIEKKPNKTNDGAFHFLHEIVSPAVENPLAAVQTLF